ncbi:glycine cleavage system aminomethyltransferase GcvT [Aquamicrobium segne]|uniref:aminomethyltransferase n=1 Tax=Aquamicrobium segne TaxID=469547 RepID=A0ABW0GZR8_9HYPH
MTGEDIRHLPLEDLHQKAGARFGAFAGWSMPLTYPAGVMKEHQHVREHVGVFDISHMKMIEISGTDSAKLLGRACPLDAAALPLLQSKYTFLLNDNAGILDDVIITPLGDNRFMVAANAGNAAQDIALLQKSAEGINATVNPLDRIFLAIQGPEAEAALNKAGIETSGLSFMYGVEPRDSWFLTRSGYTGEDGFEISLPEKDARELLEKLFSDERVMWIGLAARDSLRLEAGLCLHGNDISADTNPVDASLMWAIPKTLRAEGQFTGASALRDLIARGAVEKRVGLKPEGRQPVRAGTALFDADGNQVGRITSGGFGPSAGHPVAMGYVPASSSAIGTRFYADVRGTKMPIDVHALPFTPHRYRKG